VYPVSFASGLDFQEIDYILQLKIGSYKGCLVVFFKILKSKSIISSITFEILDIDNSTA
jgi:hypothetical protein